VILYTEVFVSVRFQMWYQNTTVSWMKSEFTYSKYLWYILKYLWIKFYHTR